MKITKNNIIKANRRYVLRKLFNNDKSKLNDIENRNHLKDMFNRDIAKKLGQSFNQTSDRLKLFYFIHLLKQRVLKDNGYYFLVSHSDINNRGVNFSNLDFINFEVN